MKKKLTVIPFVLIALLLMTSAVFANDFAGKPLVSSLSGAEEVPGPGDPDGSGHVRITLNYGQSEVCWDIHYTNIAPATAAHIHVGAAGVSGPFVVTLNPNAPGCVTVDRSLIKAIMQNPENYYVNVHNLDFRPGAIRGQLSNVGQSD